MNGVTPQVPRPLKLAIKSRWIAVRNRFVQTFLSYGPQRLLAALRELGVRPGDSVMLHSASGPQYGFKGSIEALTQVFIDAVGPQGHLLMVSLPYRSSSQQYLDQLKQFDVRHAPSMMGLVSEYFRRRPEVLRSLHPTHPMLVRGPQAHWYIEGHEACLWPCGPGTPFEKFAQRDGIVVFLNAPFATFTFFHHLEHLVHQDLPFSLYTDVAREVPVVDRDGQRRTMRTYVFTSEAIGRRRFPVLEAALHSKHLIARCRVGRSEVLAVRVRAVIDCVLQMSRQGTYFYDLSQTSDKPAANHSVEGG
jgi:aminoglycoside 3-N-acetyltransferase